ncbi:FAD-binding oxidoreductase [Rhizobiales bacterium]|uniref:FAD-binding oxidoreductase n=1 Tax=Hongsoonwoonella zoysiae TaxID=2821844 RepID=UPI001560417C|nr:FAD-binding oxidoreductase [Hongsoonwoonella zoysiae]NRG19719.1 FAD-binding oxidoreductase [Hongsoonwoonella zoysiae]
MLDPDHLKRLAAIVGEANALTEDADKAPYLREWRDLYHGRTPVVLRPGSVEEVSQVLKTANELGLKVVPQGGNTGLVGGQVPDDSAGEIVLSLSRLNRIRQIDADGYTMTVEAGCILEAIHQAADEADRIFPLTLGAQGSCQIGGNISTNAGGTAVLAYGNTRELVLGLEVVLASGEIWNGLRSLRKDNTGYDLKQLFIGAEGTLGVITAAVLKLFPKPRDRQVAFVGLSDSHAALTLFSQARAKAGPMLTGFELMPRVGIEFCLKHLEGARDPLSEPHPWYVLVELSSGTENASLRDLMEELLGEAFEAGLVQDAALAESIAQADAFWHLRHGMSEVQREEGGSIKHDVSVPVASVPAFLDKAIAAVEEMVPGCRPVPFGHMGDGNIHFNISQPVGADKAGFIARWNEMNALVHGIVAEFGGSISAEHGIGRLKRDLLKEVKSELELDMMQRIKAAFDPNGILNPGRVL